jgi:hypothetical protein
MNTHLGPGLTRGGRLFLLFWFAITGERCWCLMIRAASLSIGC